MSNNKAKSMGEKIRDLRMRSERSLQQLADAVGVSTPHIYELEHDKVNNPSVTVIKKIAEIFDVTASYFLENNDDTQFQVMFRDLQKDFSELSSKDREVVELMVKALKARSESDKN
jgi:transcriptional regulator with XRE-family HTH domain